jgi:hypothetical protein
MYDRVAYNREWRRRNREKVREALRRRQTAMELDPRVGTEGSCSRCGRSMVLTPARLARSVLRCWACRGAATKAETERRYRAAHPEKVRAHWAVYKAVKKGKLIRKPCEVCGVERSQAHHHDYSKPLDVRWLCKKCHEAEHHPHLRKAS